MCTTRQASQTVTMMASEGQSCNKKGKAVVSQEWAAPGVGEIATLFTEGAPRLSAVFVFKRCSDPFVNMPIDDYFMILNNILVS